MIKHKIKYSFFSTLAALFGGKKLRNKKLMNGIILISSIAAMISCNPSKKTTYNVEPMDSTLDNDTIKTTCYKKVANPNTENVAIPDTQNIDDQIMCYKQVVPKHDDNEKEPRK